MPDRITNLQTTQLFINQIFRQRTTLEEQRLKVSSGLDIARPSDDPAQAATIAQFQSTLQRLHRHQDRISAAQGILQQQEGVLDSAEQLMLRAKEIATSTADTVTSTRDRAQASQEIFALRDSLVALANTKYQGAYLYGGTDDANPPFSAQAYTEPSAATDPAHDRYVYHSGPGFDQTRSVQINDSELVRLTSRGDTVFQGAIASLERLGRALAGYRTTPEQSSSLPDGGGVAFSLPSEALAQQRDILFNIDSVETGREDFSSERTDVGSRSNRLQTADDVLKALSVNTEQVRSSIQDTDIFEGVSRLQNLEIGLEALLAAGSRINSLSLLNFL